MATSSSYCTHRDVKDIYPNIDEYDSKVPLYGWVIDDNLGYQYNSGLVTMLYKDGQELGSPQSTSGAVDSVGDWYYDSDTDRLWYYFGSSNTDPNNTLMEAGEDFPTIMTRTISNASRYFDSRVDANLPRDQWKDKSGNYDYLIVRTTAIVSVCFLLDSVDPTNPVKVEFWKEVNFNFKQLNEGRTKLSNRASSDSALGILREVSVNSSSTIRPVDTRGSYSGVYDLLKIKVTDVSTNGTNIGEALFSVWGRDGSGVLKSNKIVSDEKITGSYQSIGNGLQIRFSAPEINGTDDISTLNDEWELECWGASEMALENSSSSYGNTLMTRR